MGDAQGPTQDRGAPEPGQDQGDAAPGPSTSDPQPDDTEPTPERQAEFRAAYDRNLLAGRPPYAGVEIHTRGELHWVLRERGWSGDTGRLADRIDPRETDLSGAILTGADLGLANLAGAALVDTNLTDADLTGANLTDAFLDGANLTRADLGVANLTGANLNHVTLTKADLDVANLTGAKLISATLTGANLGSATLTGANLGSATLTEANLRRTNLSGAMVGANLEGVNLTAARMDGATNLGTFTSPVPLDAQTRLLDVVWNGANLAAVQWEKAPRLGDEEDIKAATDRQERIKALTDAARTYRGLARALQAQGLTDHALHYRTRQYQLERKALFWQGRIGPWVFSHLLNLVSGYGDRPGRALGWYLGVVGAFTAAYWAITNQVLGVISTQSAHLRWYEALVLSISSFHGRGFFPQMISLGDPVALIAAAEAILGLFIELVFIATFTQRFFSR